MRERERAKDRENKLGRESLENGFHESLGLNLISEPNKAILTPRQTQTLLYFLVLTATAILQIDQQQASRLAALFLFLQRNMLQCDSDKSLCIFC